jgi:hypothetical protein
MGHEFIEFDKGSGIKKKIEPLSSGQLSGFMVFLDASFAAT